MDSENYGAATRIEDANVDARTVKLVNGSLGRLPSWLQGSHQLFYLLVDIYDHFLLSNLRRAFVWTLRPHLRRRPREIENGRPYVIRHYLSSA